MFLVAQCGEGIGSGEQGLRHRPGDDEVRKAGPEL